MTRTTSLPRTWRSLSALVVVAFLAIFSAVGLQTAAASKDAPAVPAPPTQPTSADQIQNIDQVKTAIKAYYGDTVTSTPDPVNGTTALHAPSPTGAYAHEMAGLEKTASAYLADPKHASGSSKEHGKPTPPAAGSKAILLDVDDTTLNTYNYEIYSNFVYNPTSNAAFVNGAAFPAVFGMPDLVNRAKAEGYTVFFLTGRPEAQRAGTVTNLTTTGYPVDNANLYLKDQTKPYLASCAPTCTTIQYKSLTRKYIESQGYDIVANFGDQYSDLTGGYADRTFKLPNPMYYLP